MNTRSIQFRLICWYTGLILLVALAFGAYTYHSLEFRLYKSTEQTLTRRAQQIGNDILASMPVKNRMAIAEKILDVYSPEVNNRFIRILTGDRSILYMSGNPTDGHFDPGAIPLPATLDAAKHFEPLTAGSMLIVDTPVVVNGNRYLVEMGAPTDEIDSALHNLLVTLLTGLPLVILVVAVGGYRLINRALKPVEAIRATAESITFGNLSSRLPAVKTGDALEHLSVTLNQMLERLEAAFQQARRFSADASHELRTPLTIVRTELESIVREPSLSDELRERCGSVLEETEHLSRITESLFAMSRLDAGEGKIENVLCDLAALARNTAEQILLLAEEKSIRVSIHAEKPIWVSGDPTRLKQVVINLLDNAIKYTPQGGSVALRVVAVSSRAMLEVRDTGLGIPPRALPFVFERFYRAEEARIQETDGAGIGLSIVRAICQAHGGAVEIDSNEGSGTQVRIELPLASAPEA